jgi:DNA-binding CsgD family transcriptional regulator
MLKKDSAAVELGRKGGKASAEKLTREQRKQKARRAAQTRWAKQPGDWTSLARHRLGGRQLTNREWEVAEFAAKGRSNKWIGEQLRISPDTVKKHVSEALRKLGVRNRTELAILLTNASPASETRKGVPAIDAHLSPVVLLHAAKEAFERAQYLLEKGKRLTKPEETRPNK